MNESRRWNDNPSIDIQVAQIGQTLLDFVSETRRDHARVLGELETQSKALAAVATSVALQGQDIARNRQEIEASRKWREEHSNIWHGRNDENLMERFAASEKLWAEVVPLIDERRDGRAVKTFMARFWKMMTASAALGGTLVGLVLGASKLLDLV